MPSQGEDGPISIWPTVKAVVIHAPSSKPAWTAPRTSARPKVGQAGVERRYDGAQQHRQHADQGAGRDDRLRLPRRPSAG